MENGMIKIEMIYGPAVQAGESEFGYRMQTREFEVPEGTDISNIIGQVHATSLAKWVGSSSGGYIKGDFMSSGKLENGMKYRILSKNIPETIKAMDNLKELRI